MIGHRDASCSLCAVGLCEYLTSELLQAGLVVVTDLILGLSDLQSLLLLDGQGEALAMQLEVHDVFLVHEPAYNAAFHAAVPQYCIDRTCKFEWQAPSASASSAPAYLMTSDRSSKSSRSTASAAPLPLDSTSAACNLNMLCFCTRQRWSVEHF